jgi:hypothetical protein
MLGQSEAIQKRPPRGNGTGERGEVFATAFTGASTTAAVLPGTGIPALVGCFVTFVADADCYIRFGTSAVAAATTSDWLLPANVERDFWCNPTEDTNFSVIQKTAAGTLKRFRSNG